MPTVYSPPVSTYVALATTTLSATASSVTFSSIPASYRDLVLVAQVPNHSGVAQVYLRYNGDSGANYTNVYMRGIGSAAQSGSDSLTINYLFNYAPVNAVAVTQIMDYSATDKHKTLLTRTNMPSSATVAYASRWADTSAINSIEVFTNAGTLNAGSVLSLYGIAS